MITEAIKKKVVAKVGLNGFKKYYSGDAVPYRFNILCGKEISEGEKIFYVITGLPGTTNALAGEFVNFTANTTDGKIRPLMKPNLTHDEGAYMIQDVLIMDELNGRSETDILFELIDNFQEYLLEEVLI